MCLLVDLVFVGGVYKGVGFLFCFVVFRMLMFVFVI